MITQNARPGKNVFQISLQMFEGNIRTFNY